MSPYFAAEFTTNNEGRLDAKYMNEEGTMTSNVQEAKVFDSKTEAEMEILR